MGERFRPFVGTNYEAGVVNGYKLLLIGESHYNEPGCEPCGPDATREVVASYLAGADTPFFDYMFRASSGHGIAFTRDEFWQRVAFANFIQRPMETASHRPTTEDWEAGLAPFWDTVEEYKPDLVFMFTSAWSRWLPNLAPNGDATRTGPVGDDDTWLWRYGLADRDVLIARFYHRSARPNPSVSVWKAWADHCWQALETSHG